jgi:hypothetical protein
MLMERVARNESGVDSLINRTNSEISAMEKVVNKPPSKITKNLLDKHLLKLETTNEELQRILKAELAPKQNTVLKMDIQRMIDRLLAIQLGIQRIPTDVSTQVKAGAVLVALNAIGESCKSLEKNLRRLARLKWLRRGQKVVKIDGMLKDKKYESS